MHRYQRTGRLPGPHAGSGAHRGGSSLHHIGCRGFPSHQHNNRDFVIQVVAARADQFWITAGELRCLCICTAARRICCLRNWRARVEFSPSHLESSNELQEFPSGEHRSRHQLARGDCSVRVADKLVGDAGFPVGAAAGVLFDGMLRGRWALLLRLAETLCRRAGPQRRRRNRASCDSDFLSLSGYAVCQRQGFFASDSTNPLARSSL
jgi:hypothetical protein